MTLAAASVITLESALTPHVREFRGGFRTVTFDAL
jgi:hypothetical protein